MPNIKPAIIALTTITLLAACSTYQDVATGPAYRTQTITDVSAEPLSACFEALANEDQSGSLNSLAINRTSNPRAGGWIVSFRPNTSAITYLYSVAFTDRSDGTLVELRTAETIWDTPVAPIDLIESQIAECQTLITAPA